jgi:hypothetical protein
MNAEWFAPENKDEESCSNLDMIMVYVYFLSDTKTKHVSISEQAAMAMPPEERKKPILLHLLVPLCAMSIFFSPPCFSTYSYWCSRRYYTKYCVSSEDMVMIVTFYIHF